MFRAESAFHIHALIGTIMEMLKALGFKLMVERQKAA